MDPYVWFQKGITKSCDHPLPSTTSHNFTASTHNQPQPVIISPSPPATLFITLFIIVYYYLYFKLVYTIV